MIVETALETVEETRKWMKTAWGIDAPLEPIITAIQALGQEDVLEKVRAEIEDLTYYSWEISPRTVIDDVLKIIDKYRNESEDV